VSCAGFAEARQWLDRNLAGRDVVLIENDLPDLYERPLRAVAQVEGKGRVGAPIST